MKDQKYYTLVTTSGEREAMITVVFVVIATGRALLNFYLFPRRQQCILNMHKIQWGTRAEAEGGHF